MAKRDNVQKLLAELLETILKEREHAKKHDMNALINDMVIKEKLVTALQPVVRSLNPAEQELARKVKQANEHNAFLFRSTLNWLGQTLENFGRKKTPVFYGQSGAPKNMKPHGRLLSGKA